MRTIISLLFVSSLIAGCKTRAIVGHFGDNAFYAARDHYRVRYLDGLEQPRGLLPAGWQIANFREENGRPGAPHPFRGEEEVLELIGPQNRMYSERVPPFELRYLHADGSILFVRSVPVQADRPASVLLHEYVQRSARGMRPRVALLGEVRPSRYLSFRTLYEGPARVDEHRAHHATLEVVTSQDGTEVSFVTLLVVPVERAWRARRPWQTLLVVGLATVPDAHDVHVGELTSFAERLDLSR